MIEGFGTKVIKDLNIDEGDILSLKATSIESITNEGDHTLISYNEGGFLKVYGLEQKISYSIFTISGEATTISLRSCLNS